MHRFTAPWMPSWDVVMRPLHVSLHIGKIAYHHVALGLERGVEKTYIAAFGSAAKDKGLATTG
ncbi:hypothetical protein KOM00_20090 [Geomonas sp. Red69]|uniref:hypothetical protein n=1 Tax=Geomonas diazotrophica TaxID=2843197 RepID=UPI001C114536|nr:hypothetical protein [Geomonas diazotrophica]MBU5639025.1 hypothetical protein [Geomonas diazotrophica]